MNNYVKLAGIDVGNHIEKKGSLSYLSWSWAVDRLLREDPLANWEYHEPKYYGDTVMVSVTVTAFGKPVTMQLPVMDNRNNAVSKPCARKISDAQMRAIVKAIACHGLGLYIYAGQDLPEDDTKPNPLDQVVAPKKFDGTFSKAADEAVKPPAKLKPGGGFMLHIPGKDSTQYADLAEWLNGYQELGAKVMGSKLTPAEKWERLQALRHTNQPMIAKLDTTERVMMSALMAKQKAELGIA